MAPVIDAVGYLHRQEPSIIHGNIKLTTIIVPKARGKALLVGLGTAQEYDSDATMAAVRSRSSSYRAPSQYGTDTEIQTDIYGLGAVFYTLITGVVPADAPSLLAQMDNEGSDPLQPVHVAEVIERAVSLDAREHFSSAEQLWEALWAVEPSFGARRMPFVSSRSPHAAKRGVTRPATVSAPKQPRASHTGKLAVLLIVLVVLSGLGVSADSLSHVLTRSANPIAKQRLPSPTPTVRSSTPTLTSVPVIPGGAYKGTIYDIPAKVGASLTLTNVQHSQGKMSGILAVGPGLLGNGPFSGTLDSTTDRLQFTVRDDAGNPTLFFEGTIQSPTSMSGDYYRCIPILANPCHKTTVGYGIWNVLLSS
jgi:hypothetical protein